MTRRTNRWLYGLVVVIFLIWVLGPLLWTVLLSLTPETEMLGRTTDLLPHALSLDNYKNILLPGSRAHATVFNGLMNSLKMAGITVAIGLPIATMTGYAFARFRFQGRRLVLYFLLLTIVIPVFTTIIPIYAMFAERGWLDSQFWMSIIYISAFLPMTTWMAMTYFQAIPQELWEAARTDGCSEWQAFTKVILPNSYPILVSCLLMLFLMSWSQYQIPMILSVTQDTKVVTLVMSEFMTRTSVNYGAIATTGLLAILPPALLALLFKRYLLSGLMSGAVKG